MTDAKEGTTEKEKTLHAAGGDAPRREQPLQPSVSSRDLGCQSSKPREDTIFTTPRRETASPSIPRSTSRTASPASQPSALGKHIFSSSRGTSHTTLASPSAPLSSLLSDDDRKRADDEGEDDGWIGSDKDIVFDEKELAEIARRDAEAVEEEKRLREAEASKITAKSPVRSEEEKRKRQQWMDRVLEQRKKARREMAEGNANKDLGSAGADGAQEGVHDGTNRGADVDRSQLILTRADLRSFDKNDDDSANDGSLFSDDHSVASSGSCQQDSNVDESVADSVLSSTTAIEQVSGFRFKGINSDVGEMIGQQKFFSDCILMVMSRQLTETKVATRMQRGRLLPTLRKDMLFWRLQVNDPGRQRLLLRPKSHIER